MDCQGSIASTSSTGMVAGQAAVPSPRGPIPAIEEDCHVRQETPRRASRSGTTSTAGQWGRALSLPWPAGRCAVGGQVKGRDGSSFS